MYAVSICTHVCCMCVHACLCTDTYSKHKFTFYKVGVPLLTLLISYGKTAEV